MKKYLPYLFAVLILSGIIILFATGKKKKPARRLDERLTLRRQDKIPYGTYVAYKGLHHLFPEASVSVSNQEPGYWDSLSLYDAGQAYIVVADNFNADIIEIQKLIRFAKKGNDVFISAKTISDEMAEALGCRTMDLSEPVFSEDEDGKITYRNDSLRVRLSKPFFESDSLFIYPGRNFSASFTKFDQSVTNALGKGDAGVTNFIHLRTGKGNLYLHLAPLAFSNFFLLHKDNIRYYEMAMSVIDPDVTKIVWDEYYMSKGERPRSDGKKKGWFSVLMNTKNEAGDKPFRAAFWILIALLLLYVLMEMRRKQRIIPVVVKPRNDSLEFVKTIGRLYYDKGNHKNLCRKMAAFFQEHVRMKYKLPTGNMNEEFIHALQYKSGVPDYEIRGIVSFIKYLDDAATVSDTQLSDFYKELESFYQKA